jgi:glutathione synthase/RimK-type ligase-like ATP-grasp enzyme
MRKNGASIHPAGVRPKLKLGLWLPTRHSLSTISVKSPGMWLTEFRDSFLEKLKRTQCFELFEDLDFRQATIHHGDVCLGSVHFHELDAFFWFGEIDRELTSFDLNVLDAIATKTVVFNGAAAQRLALDKFNTQLFLQRAGIQVPEYHLVTRENIATARLFFKDKRYLLKPRLGSFGQGIVRLSSFDALLDVVDYSQEKVHFIEEFLQCAPDSWIGVNVIGGKIAFGYTKEFTDRVSGAWKHWDRSRQGGHMRLKQPTPEQAEIALGVRDALGLDFLGVDMIHTQDGRDLVIDVNTFPGLYPEMFQQAGMDGSQMVVDMLVDRLMPDRRISMGTKPASPARFDEQVTDPIRIEMEIA